MHQRIYTVYDKRAKQFGAPMVMPTDAHAVRAFTDEVNRAADGNNLHNYPDDFAIYYVCTFNANQGMMESEGEPKLILEAAAAKRPPKDTR